MITIKKKVKKGSSRVGTLVAGETFEDQGIYYIVSDVNGEEEDTSDIRYISLLDGLVVAFAFNDKVSVVNIQLTVAGDSRD